MHDEWGLIWLRRSCTAADRSCSSPSAVEGVFKVLDCHRKLGVYKLQSRIVCGVLLFDSGPLLRVYSMLDVAMTPILYIGQVHWTKSNDVQTTIKLCRIEMLNAGRQFVQTSLDLMDGRRSGRVQDVSKYVESELAFESPTGRLTTDPIQKVMLKISF